MDVREINRLTLAGKPVVALYLEDDGVEVQARIIAARRKGGILQGKTMTTLTWVNLHKVWQA